MRFSLMPREMRFFDMFDDATAILTRAAGRFLDMVTHFDRLEARGMEIKQEEHDLDDAIERILKALDRSFITPFDREDIHTLATSLDDVLDNMEETAHRFVVFRIQAPTPAAVAMAHIIHECCTHLEAALGLCRGMKNIDEIHNRLREITRLENEAD